MPSTNIKPNAQPQKFTFNLVNHWGYQPLTIPRIADVEVFIVVLKVKLLETQLPTFKGYSSSIVL